MQLILTLSHWAKGHARLAMVLIVVLEVVNGFNGVLLGATLLADLPTASLYLATALLLIFATDIRRLYYSGPDTKVFRRWCLFGAFLGNFLLFGLIGGLLVPRPQRQTPSTDAWGYRRIEVWSDTLIRPDTLRPVESSLAVANVNRRSDRSIKSGFVGMLVVGILLALLTGLLACSAACSGYGFVAGVVTVLGLGFLAGGIYFSGRSKRKPLRDWGESTGTERRRNAHRFWLTWAVLAVAAGLIHITISKNYLFR